MYIELSKVRGRQFFKSLLQFPLFRMHVMTPSRHEVEKEPTFIHSEIYLKIQSFRSSRKNSKNSFEKPSGPGAF